MKTFFAARTKRGKCRVVIHKNFIYAALALAAGLGVWLFTGQRAGQPGPLPPAIESALPSAQEAGALPVSVRELLNNLTEYAPAPPHGNGRYKGLLMAAEPRAVQLERTDAGVKISLQNAGGKTKEWTQEDVKLFKFKEDRESLVLGFPDKTFVYLKFSAGQNLSAYPQSLKTMTGWQIKDDKKTALKIVLIEDIHESQPRAESLREILPPELPY